ncbi:MAG: hypothetical protein LUD46_08285, partial [Parabacteroides sp.]|nr:hypothetical protein [Parabacteroides sp.]
LTCHTPDSPHAFPILIIIMLLLLHFFRSPPGWGAPRKIINSSSASDVKEVILNHGQSTFNINFSSLNFIAPSSIQYAYRMLNMDKDWITLGERNIVYFTELHPGDYTFEVKVANLSNNWGANITRLHITVLPPW